MHRKRETRYVYGSNEYSISLWWRLLGRLSWYAIFKSSICYSIENRAPVDETYGRPILKYVAETSLRDRVPE